MVFVTHKGGCRSEGVSSWLVYFTWVYSTTNLTIPRQWIIFLLSYSRLKSYAHLHFCYNYATKCDILRCCKHTCWTVNMQCKPLTDKLQPKFPNHFRTFRIKLNVKFNKEFVHIMAVSESSSIYARIQRLNSVPESSSHKFVSDSYWNSRACL